MPAGLFVRVSASVYVYGFHLIDQIDKALLVDYAELAIDIASMRSHGCL